MKYVIHNLQIILNLLYFFAYADGKLIEKKIVIFTDEITYKKLYTLGILIKNHLYDLVIIASIMMQKIIINLGKSKEK